MKLLRCQCGHYVVMETSQECKCCRDTVFVTLIKNEVLVPAVQCLTEHPDFIPACLNITILKTAYYSYRQRYSQAEGTIIM